MENDHGVLTRTVVWTDVSTTYADYIFRVKKILVGMNVENKGRKKKRNNILQTKGQTSKEELHISADN